MDLPLINLPLGFEQSFEQSQCQSHLTPFLRNLSNDCSALCKPRPRKPIRSSRFVAQASITWPFSNELMISGHTYDPRQTAGVLPSTTAVSLIASTMRLFRAVFLSGISPPLR